MEDSVDENNSNRLGEQPFFGNIQIHSHITDDLGKSRIVWSNIHAMTQLQNLVEDECLPKILCRLWRKEKDSKGGASQSFHH